jgi:hypothetical protein
MQLRQYQSDIAAQAKGLLLSYKIVYLCMEVRTGKTFTSFEAARLYGAKKVLFVTKLKAIGSIKKDFEAAGTPFELYLINYDMLHKCESDFDLIILDEAHSIAQYPAPSKRTIELKRICTGKPIIYLSGTPAPESHSQFYHQFWVSSFSPWKDYKTFYAWHKDYGIPKKKYVYNRELADYSGAKLEMIQPIIQKYMITYTQQEAGFEAFVEEHIIKIPMSDKIRTAVNLLRKNKIFTTKDGLVIMGDTAVKEMNKVHQICSGTVKGECGNFVAFDSSKADYIKNNFEGRKIAIFYKYVAEAVQLQWTFAGRIFTDPMAFNDAGPDAVFISQIQSGREGINISTADCLIMYNIDFAALSYWQGRARLQTKDRVKAAELYWLFTDGGIEQRIYEVVMKKKDFTTIHYKKLGA